MTEQETQTDQEAAAEGLPTNEEQRRLHDAMVKELAGVFAGGMGDMTLLTAMEAATNFYVAALLQTFFMANALPKLEPRVIGKEVENRVRRLKGQMNGSKAKERK